MDIITVISDQFSAENIRKILLENQFAQGGVVVALLTAMWHHLKGMPKGLLSRCGNLLFRQITIKRRDNHRLFTTLLDDVYRHGTAIFPVAFDMHEPEWKYQVQELHKKPSFASGWFFWRGIPIRLTYHNEQISNVQVPSPWILETVTLTAPFWAVRRLERCVQDLFQETLRRITGSVICYGVPGNDDTTAWSYTPKFNLKNIYISETHREILEKIQKWENMKSLFIEFGKSHKLGIALSGPPGTGKSTFIRLIAQMTDRCIIKVPLDAEWVKDEDLAKIMSLDKQCIFVIEDIDTLLQGREPLKHVKWTFSGLLNAISGIAEMRGILIITSNHIGTQDPALLRPGRIDHCFELTHPTDEDKSTFLNQLNVPRPERIEDMTWAALQDYAFNWLYDNSERANEVKQTQEL